MIIRNARVLTFDSANRVLDSGAVEILPDGSIGQVGDTPAGDRRGTPWRAPTLVRSSDKNEESTASRTPATQPPAPPLNPLLSKERSSAHEKVINAQGKLLMPALINCHTHLYSTLARGISLPGRAPRNFPEILKKLWWRLDRALNLDDVYYSALVGLIDSAKCGVGTLVDHHSSPNACAGKPGPDRARFPGSRPARGFVLRDFRSQWEASAAEGIRENIRFLERQSSGSGRRLGGRQLWTARFFHAQRAHAPARGGGE